MIYVTADTHGERERFEEKSIRRLKKGDTLIVLGGFRLFMGRQQG